MNTARHIAPGPSLFYLATRFHLFRADPMRELNLLRARHGDLIRMNVPFVAHLISHPDHIEHFLVNHSKNCLDRGKDFRFFKPLMGQGTLTANGSPWVEARKRAVRTMAQPRLDLYAKVMQKHVLFFCERWLREKDGAVMDIQEEIETLSFAISAELMLGTEQPEELKTVREAVRFNARIVGDSMHAPIKLPDWVPTPRRLHGKKLIQEVDGLIRKIVARVEADPGEDRSLLAQLVRSGADFIQVRDEVVTLLVTGYETTASMLIWAIYCLSMHADLQEEIAKELRIDPSTPQIEYVLKEALRLYPPLLNFSRRILEDDQLDGYSVPAGSILNFVVYLTHRHPDFWPDANAFIPSRFADKNVGKGHPMAWIPFGVGARVCVGARFAMMQGQLTLDMLMKYFRFKSLGPVLPNINVITMPKNGLFLKVYHRTANSELPNLI